MSTFGEHLNGELDFLSPEVRARLVERWNEPQRIYHNETHLRHVLQALDFLEAEGESFDGTAVRLAAWFHCAVFEPTGSENAKASAEVARRLLEPAAPIDEVQRLILVTSGHRVDKGDLNAAALSDADLSILGAEPDIYEEYAADIRHEYAHVPGEKFVAGRCAALESLLGHAPLFHTASGHDEWDKQARANLHREVGLLRATER